MSQLKKNAFPAVSETCFMYTSRAHCTKCDADVGTGMNEGNYLCMSYCDEWRMACKDDMLDPYLDSSEVVPFCRDDSLICSPVNETVSSGREFCKIMGFKALSLSEQLGIDEDEEDPLKELKMYLEGPESSENKKLCFDGFPR